MSEKKFNLVAIFKAKKEYAQQIKEEMKKLVEPTLAEEGCIEYILHFDNLDERTCLVYETWHERNDLEIHRQTPHMQAFYAFAKDKIEEKIVYELTKAD